MDSEIAQKISIYEKCARIDFDTYVNWKESEILLKAEFPMDIITDKASYEIQYGAVERPTHKNTSWDRARFEVCAHKWADVSEPGYGVSLINDSKYGYSVTDGTISLTLIKCGMYPNPNADREIHTFKYSLYAHKNTWHDSDVVKQAFFVNCPMSAKPSLGGGSLPESFSMAKTNCENAVITVIKQAYSGNGTVIRLYESEGKRSDVTMSFGIKFKSAKETDMLETNVYGEVDIKDNEIRFTLKPYEIKTFWLC